MWKTIKNNFGEIYLLEKKTSETSKRSVHLPILIRGKTKYIGDGKVALTEKRKKHSAYLFYFAENHTVASSLEGRKVKITIEVED